MKRQACLTFAHFGSALLRTPPTPRTSLGALSLMPIEIAGVLRTIQEERPVREHLPIAHKRARNQRIVKTTSIPHHKEQDRRPPFPRHVVIVLKNDTRPHSRSELVPVTRTLRYGFRAPLVEPEREGEGGKRQMTTEREM